MIIKNVQILNNRFLISINYLILSYFLFIIQFKEILSDLNGNFQSLNYANISENAAIIDITDYHNLYLLITTEKNIYTGIPPNKISSTTSKIINITAAATYDSNYVLLACTEDYLLSKVNIQTGNEEPLLDYERFNFSIVNLNYTCCICIYENFAYVGINQIIDNSYLKYNVIQIGLELNNENDGPLLNETLLKIYRFIRNITYFGLLTYPRQISCEVISDINNLNNFRLVCGYIKYESNKFKYIANAMNQNFEAFGSDYTVKNSDELLSFRLQRINNTFIRYLVTKNSYEISVNSSMKIKSAPSGIRNANLISFSSRDDAFSYHNQHIFTAIPTDSSNINDYCLYLKSNISDNYLRIMERSKYIHRVLGYYDENNDYLIVY